MTADTYSSTLGVLLMGTGNDNNSWGSNQNTAVFQILEDSIANALSSAVTGGTLDLSGSPPPAAASQARYASLIFTGVLGSNQTVQVPNLTKWWFVKNATSGAFALKFKTPSGSASTAIPQNSGWQLVYCDGANNIVVSPHNFIQTQMPDGTAALPAYSYVNDTKSGWYRAGTQDYRLSINGVAVLQVTGTGATPASVVNVLSPGTLQVNGGAVLAAGATFLAADGTVSAPGIAFNSEAGSGFYRTGAGVVSFAILGVLRATVTANDFTWKGGTYGGTDLSPSSFSTNQNDYNPTSLATATCLRLNVTATCSLTGISGGAAGRELELINIGTTTLQCPANSGSSSAANRFANQFNLAPGQSITLRYDATSSLWRPKNIATATSSCAMASVSGDLLVVNGGSPNTTLTITAGEAVLTDSNGDAIKFENVAVSIDSTTTGVGGCDSGTRAASTSYFIYLVSDGTNINAMISTSATSPSLANAANYIYFKRIGWQRTDGSSNFARIRTMGKRSQYVVSAAGTTALPVMGNSNVGNAGWTAIALAAFVPTTAIRIDVFGYITSTGTMAVAPNNLYALGGGANAPPLVLSQPNAIGTTISMLLESTNIYYNSNSASNYVACLGFEDNI